MRSRPAASLASPWKPLSLPDGVLAGAWLGIATLLLVLVGLLYRPLLIGLQAVWQSDANYSHGPLVPLVAALLAVLAHRRHAAADWTRPTGWTLLGATTLLAAGLAMHLVAWFLEHVLLDVISLIVVLQAALRLLGGRSASSRYGFAVLFLIFMAPLPMHVHDALARQLQQIVSVSSTFCLDSLGISAFQQGYSIHLPAYVMEVGVACSGMRQLLAIVATAVVIGYLDDHNLVGRLTLALLVVPIAVAANCARVVLTGVILIWFGPKWADGVFHTLEGLAVILLAGILVLIASRLIKAVCGGRHETRSERPVGELNAGNHRTVGLPPLPARPISVTALLFVLLGMALVSQNALQRHLSQVTAAPPVELLRPLDQLPHRLGAWVGQDVSTTESLDHADGQLQRRYFHPERRQMVTVWLVHSLEGEDRYHHPEVCMAAAGVPEVAGLRRAVRIDEHSEPIQQFAFGQGADFQRIFYWHYSLTPPPAANLSGIQQHYRAVRFRPSSLSIQVFSPGRSAENAVYAGEFVKLLDEAIQSHVGPEAARGSKRLPIRLLASR